MIAATSDCRLWSNIFNNPIFCHCTGHSAPVRSVYVQDSEHCFLSASKDKTVKLWSLSNHGDGTAQSASSWTYYRHTRPVFHVGMVESVRHAVSCDGSLHVSYHSVSLRRGCLSTSIQTLWSLSPRVDGVREREEIICNLSKHFSIKNSNICRISIEF